MTTATLARPSVAQFAAAALSMAVVVLASNILVQFPINDWLTWGAITYPVAFLVSELVNRAHGPQQARRVAWVGFAVAVVASLVLAPARIAIASGTAFLLSQWLDIGVFDRCARTVGARRWCHGARGQLYTAIFGACVCWHRGPLGDLGWAIWRETGLACVAFCRFAFSSAATAPRAA